MRDVITQAVIVAMIEASHQEKVFVKPARDFDLSDDRPDSRVSL
jgi:hypothetical protein